MDMMTRFESRREQMLKGFASDLDAARDPNLLRALVEVAMAAKDRDDRATWQSATAEYRRLIALRDAAQTSAA